ncbi:MAG: indole-3-glycerol-phosphate synthase [Deltaproteobacteria bacterium]|nr:indole-3-glycerol-phosphate synthase [Deltaproteobacteria bacterium]MBW2210098.1 indole-3-glycerol-phosphate synthase [Deltaproteobacteria bacterium]MBW2549413.1 indole-3-glycerol-phosphate synthase [Deltaproteobacteria bacterium]MBW2626299.1 indole-3-glycerol-phosphate synthase [Deltaproteobacteria bacterium]MBW2684622.1 indole-3-glycerol-phosphate synthase [Deltaproteobacteria bacterium]
MTDVLSAILARKRRENSRRRRHVAAMQPVERVPQPERSERGIRALRRAPGESPSVVAEVKFRSPSAGEIHPWSPGEGIRIAQGYERGGASAVSVLADGPGFGGSPLLVRRVVQAVSVPVLYKGFVLDPVQVDLAYDVGASLVLLLVRALEDIELRALIQQIRSLGMEPVVEAANSDEIDRALAAGSTIVGVNARDLSTFRVDKEAARDCVARIPMECVAVFMSGVHSADDLSDVAQGRADAVLIGEGLMRFEDPGARLSELLTSV